MLKYSYKLLTSLCLSFILFSATAMAASEPFVRVGVLVNESTATISATDDFVMKAPKMHRVFRFPQGKQLVFKYNGGNLLLNNKPLPDDNIIIAVKNKNPILINGKKYRGAVNLLVNSRGITVVNRLPMEQYLYGVVPAEMPPSWPQEALKAQAVAARTFALNYQKEHPAATSYDVCATTECQVYNGMSDEYTSTNQAINATRGQILTYNHQPIIAVFHAASGGSTVNSEDAWNSPIPYLRAVSDTTEKSPYNNWVKEYSADQFRNIINSKYGPLGRIKTVDMSHYPKNKPSAIKPQIKIIDENNRSVTLNGADFRSLFKLNSSNITIQTIKPANLPKTTVNRINPVANTTKLAVKPNPNTLKAKHVIGNLYTDSNNNTSISIPPVAIAQPTATTSNLPTSFKIIGSGLGHRLGLSQWGAKSLADTGKKYNQILDHYYTNVVLEKLY